MQPGDRVRQDDREGTVLGATGELVLVLWDDAGPEHRFARELVLIQPTATPENQ